jgi:2-desacetyl-2-hydroxyethyl bacteriochlorophyllide A dehydrogenase
MMKSIVFTAAGPELADTPDPRPTSDEVLLRVDYCGICGTDLHAAEPDFHPGTVMGHEFTGTVVESGSDVTDFKAGDRVVVNPNGDWCGQCEQCRTGATNLCSNIWPTVIGLARPGGLTPIVPIRARTLRHLPDTLDLASAALTEPLAVALRTVRRSGITVGDDATVIGAGPIGLLVTLLLRAAGVGNITVIEPALARRKIALAVGATDVIDPIEGPLSERPGASVRSPSHVFECSGVAESLAEAVRIVRPRGVVSVTGLSRRPAAIDVSELLYKEVTIRGSFIYVDEFEQAIEMLASGRIDVTPLISGVLSIEDALSAFDAMRRSPDVVKFLIRAAHSV